jgi:hypothetical protein
MGLCLDPPVGTGPAGGPVARSGGAPTSTGRAPIAYGPMHETEAIIFTVAETVVALLAMVWFIYRVPAPADDATPSWLEPDFDAIAALDRLSLRYAARDAA